MSDPMGMRLAPALRGASRPNERLHVLRSVRAWLFGDSPDRTPGAPATPPTDAAHEARSRDATATTRGEAAPAPAEPPTMWPVGPHRGVPAEASAPTLEQESAADVPASLRDAAPSDAVQAESHSPSVSQGVAAPGAPPWLEADSATVAARQERMAERLLEDERLRGDLTDDEFRPLLDWALAASDTLAARTARLADDRADALLDAGLGQIKDVVLAAGAAVAAMLEAGAGARDSELARLAELVRPPLVPDDAVGEARARLSTGLESITRSPGLAGAELATALADALRTTTRPAGEKGGPAA